ncbi:MAG: FeoA domain-containing protein [bacterium]
MKERALLEDALKHAFECEYQKRPATADSLAGALSLSREQAASLVARIQTGGWAALKEGGIHLTEEGRVYALRVVRAHRLYETQLAQETGVEETAWHQRAELAEHAMTQAEVDNLAARLGHPRYDPHGDPIPTRSGEMPPPRGKSLLEQPEGWQGRIIHIEDEPEKIYSQIAALGLAPNMIAQIIKTDEASLHVLVDGLEIKLSRQMAANIYAVALKHGEAADHAVCRLSSLLQGEQAVVVGLSPACRGAERNRLLDLGIVPGSAIEMDLKSAFGEPVAYRVRGAAIALRKNQANHVLIKKQ